MKFGKYLIILILFFNISITLTSQEVQVLEFNNKPVADVLMVLADLSGKNVIYDNSVVGNCSYYFTTENIEEAFKLFLTSQNLYITEKNNLFNVSRVYLDEKDNLLTVNCFETDIKIVLDKLTLFTGTTILYDTLPRSFITLNIKDLPLDSVLDIIMKKNPEYIIESTPDYFYIKKDIVKNDINSSNNNTKSNGIVISPNGEYSINLNKVRFTQVLAELFDKAGFEYSIQGRNDNIIDRIEFKNKTFSQMLNLVLESGSCDYVYSNNIYYIFDINKTEVANRHMDTQIVKLKNLGVKDLLKLIPGNLIANNVLKVDEDTNSVIVYGTNIKTEPILKFIELVDKDQKIKPYWIEMNFISADLFKNILLKSYSQSSIINVDKNSFIIMLTNEEYDDVKELKTSMDLPPNSHKITLKYIKSDELLKNLPKSVTAEQIVVTPNPSVIFYYGKREGYTAFINELNQIDKPVPQIKYKILVIQNTLGDNLNFGLETKAHSENNGDITLPDGEDSAFSGALGSLLGLNFNVLSAFGPLFSFELNASIDSNKSKILVDTTLQGLSGKKVSFRNTTTSRFYQTTTNADGESEKNGATQEVSWGIILDIEGWTSGDGMITVNVQSTLSDETKVSEDSSGIPSTSEKIVNTEVRTREGEPVVIGGLLSSKKEMIYEKTPLLGDIPILGFLFRKNIETETRSEFVIYLLPYVEESRDDNVSQKIKRAYGELLK